MKNQLFLTLPRGLGAFMVDEGTEAEPQKEPLNWRNTISPAAQKVRTACVEAIKRAIESKAYLEKRGLHPLVGAVILDRDGNILAEGARRADGHNHAEVVAIKNLRSKDKNKVHTIITTLEPCCYRGDPDEICCAKRIVRLGAKQVTIGTLDPASGVRGRGGQILQMSKVYFTMFPRDLQDRVLEINRSYIQFESALYATGRRHMRGGVVKDDLEFDLSYAPTRVIRYLKGKSFQNIVKGIYKNFKSRGIPSFKFPRFFGMEVPAPGSRIAKVMEKRPKKGGPSLFELVASYKAIPPISPDKDKNVERTMVYQYIGEWWYKHRRKFLRR